MVCTKCGAGLRESDQFCPKCGTRVIKETRCPDCGAALREGTKFCHKCGSMVERSEGSGGAGVENMEDIPMDAIERNILSETEAELKADRRRERASGSDGSARGVSARSGGAGEGSSRGSGSRSVSGGESSVRGGNARSGGAGEGSGRGSGSRSVSGGESSGRGVSARGGAAGESSDRGSGSRSASGSNGSGRGTSVRRVSDSEGRRSGTRGSLGGESQSRQSRSGSSSVGGSSRGPAARNASGGRREPEPEVRRKSSVPAPPPRGNRYSYRDEDWDDDWNDEDEDWEDDDWDDDEDERVDLITIMTAALGCVILVVVALVGFKLYTQYAPKNYDQAETESSEDGQGGEDSEGSQDNGDSQESQNGQEVDGAESEIIESDNDKNTYKLKIVSNVNVRDQPSKSGTNVIKVAKAGETYTCKGSAGGGEWYEIVLEDGSTGYVFTDYVEVEE